MYAAILLGYKYFGLFMFSKNYLIKFSKSLGIGGIFSTLLFLWITFLRESFLGNNVDTFEWTFSKTVAIICCGLSWLLCALFYFCVPGNNLCYHYSVANSPHSAISYASFSTNPYRMYPVVRIFRKNINKVFFIYELLSPTFWFNEAHFVTGPKFIY